MFYEMTCALFGHEYSDVTHKCFLCDAYDPAYVKELEEKKNGKKRKSTIF